MAKSNWFENAVLNLIFNGVTIPGIADNTITSPLTNLYMSLHTANPDEDGDQTTNETSYTGYSRIAVSRDGAGWTITGSSVSPTSNVEFGECTALPGLPITHVAIGTNPTGAGEILFYGSLSSPINTDVGIIPRIKTTSTITEN